MSKEGMVVMSSDESIPKKFLNHFVGHWLGEGIARGQKVSDEMQCEWTLGERFLRVNIQQRGTDAFKAEGYFWYDEAQNRFEFYEFNNGEWPVRVMRGALTNEKLILEEHCENRDVRMMIEWIDGTSFRLTERGELFVDETFRRTERVYHLPEEDL
jgi:hypothetical protein